MITQPIALLLTFMIQLLAVGSATLLDQLSITLFLLGMQWWALFIRYQIQRGTSTVTAGRIHLVGLLVALALLVVTHLFLLNNFLMLVISAALVVWFWKQGMDQTDPERSEELLTWFFRIGFFIIIVLLVLTVLFQNPATMMVRDAMPTSLPLFFISGLVGLSFSRLANIQRESTRNGASQSSAVRNWTFGLTIAWIMIVVIAFALELYSFQAIQNLIVPVGAFLGNLITWIILGVVQVLGFIFTAIASAIAFLLHLLGISPHAAPPTSHDIAPTPTTTAGAPKLGKTPPPSELALTIGRIILAIIGVVLLFVITRVVSKRWRQISPDDSEEEEREALSRREVLNERRQERQQQGHKPTGVVLETLDPASARARYRELLQSMAEEGADRGRRPGETPSEYQKRLLVLAEQRAPLPSTTVIDERQVAAPATPTILSELTRAYNRERYGTQALDQQKRSFLQQWVPELLQRLKRKPTAPSRPGTR